MTFPFRRDIRLLFFSQLAGADLARLLLELEVIGSVGAPRSDGESSSFCSGKRRRRPERQQVSGRQMPGEWAIECFTSTPPFWPGGASNLSKFAAFQTNSAGRPASQRQVMSWHCDFSSFDFPSRDRRGLPNESCGSPPNRQPVEFACYQATLISMLRP